VESFQERGHAFEEVRGILLRSVATRSPAARRGEEAGEVTEFDRSLGKAERFDISDLWQSKIRDDSVLPTAQECTSGSPEISEAGAAYQFR
jgi:hypothetical protein